MTKILVFRAKVKKISSVSPVGQLETVPIRVAIF